MIGKRLGESPRVALDLPAGSPLYALGWTGQRRPHLRPPGPGRPCAHRHLLDSYRLASVDVGGRFADVGFPPRDLSGSEDRLAAGPFTRALFRTRTGDPFLTIEKAASQGVHQRAKRPRIGGPRWTPSPS